MPLNILIADDHGLVRDGIKSYLDALDPDANVLEAGTLDEALEQACDAGGKLDLVLLDIKMPGMEGLKGIARMKAQVPETPVVVISGYFSRGDVLQAIEEGASGYIPKTLNGEAMVNALRLVFSGETYIPSVVISENGTKTGLPVGRGDGKDNPLSRLSDRERQILGHLIDGDTNKQIARRLDLQEITIKIHLRNVYKKLGASNRAGAVRIALQHGWRASP